MNERKNERMDGRTDGRTDGPTDRRIDGPKEEQTCEWDGLRLMDRWINKLLS